MLASLCGLAPGNCGAGIVVRFDSPEYTVTGPGQQFQAQILIDADTNREGLQPIPSGLFSFGTRITFDASKASVSSTDDIDTVAALSFFGFLPGPLEQVSAGTAATKGNVNQIPNPLFPYQGTLLATVTMTNLATPFDQYFLNLDFFNTLGPSENIFVDGAGGTLDADIVFVPSRVVVIPEPVLWGPAVMGIVMLTSRRRIRAAATAIR